MSRPMVLAEAVIALITAAVVLLTALTTLSVRRRIDRIQPLLERIADLTDALEHSDTDVPPERDE